MELSDAAHVASNEICFLTTGGTTLLDLSGVRISGPEVHLNGDDGDGANGPGGTTPTLPLRRRLVDWANKPHAERDVVVSGPGFWKKTRTDSDGVIECLVPAHLLEVTVTLWLGDYPTGERTRWRLSLIERPDPNEPLGVCSRLRELGYYDGPDVETETDGLRDAMDAFRLAHGLSPGNSIDDEFAKALSNYDN